MWAPKTKKRTNPRTPTERLLCGKEMRGDKSNHDKHIVEEQCAETLDEEEEYISGKGNMNEETQEEESDDDS